MMIYCRGRYLFFLFLLTLASTAISQVPSFNHFDVSTGLPSNEVYYLKQDGKGFLWIGTESGLVRYDGNSFHSFNFQNSRGTSVSGLKEDAEGRIWFNNFSGQLFYAKGDSVFLYHPWEKYYKSHLVEFTIDDRNRLLVSNNANFIYRFDLGTNRVSKLVDSVNVKQAVAKMHDGTIVYTKIKKAELFALQENGVKRIPIVYQNGQTFVQSKSINQFQFNCSFANKQTIALQRRDMHDKEPYLYYYENGKMYVHPATRILQLLKLFPLSVYDDDGGNLFVGTEAGLVWLKKSGADYYLQKHFLKSEAISSIIKGKEGGVWIATLKNGIFHIPDLNIWISNGLEMGLKTDGISNLAIVNKDKLFASSTAGEVFRYQKFSANPVVKFPSGYQRDVQALEYDSTSGNLFISKLLTGILNPSTKEFIEHDFAVSPKDYFFRSDGVTFLSGNAILAVVKKGNNTLAEAIAKEFEYTHELADVASGPNYIHFYLKRQRCKGIWYQQKEKLLWVGFVDGLQYHENKHWIKYYDPETKTPIVATSFSELSDGTLCIGTIDQGLYLIKQKKIVSHFTVKNGLLSNRIKRIASNDKSIWMVMPKAIQGYRFSDKKFTKLGIANYASKYEIFDAEILRDTVYLATSKGIQFFPENINSLNSVRPFASIASFIVDGKAFSVDHDLDLPFNIKNIAITMQGIALKSAGNFLYQYRLLGADTAWLTNKASENVVRFASLPSGKYVFQARVVNEDGIISKQTPSVSFVIDQEWWKKWWFFLLIVLIIAGVAYYFFTLRINVLEKKNLAEIEKVRLLEDMRNSQLSALKAQMNPHFMFNALNSIQEIIMLNDKKQANLYLGKFADLMRITLDQSNKKSISLEDELKSLKLYLELETLRFEEHFKYEIKVSETLNPYSVQIPSMLIQPYVENALKHGLMHKLGDKKLALHFSLFNENTLLCVITDNGIGRKRSSEINRLREKRHSSFGTGATQKRLELLNYGKEQYITVSFVDLKDDIGNDNGTQVMLYIPLIL